MTNGGHRAGRKGDHVVGWEEIDKLGGHVGNLNERLSAMEAVLSEQRQKIHDQRIAMERLQANLGQAHRNLEALRERLHGHMENVAGTLIGTTSSLLSLSQRVSGIENLYTSDNVPIMHDPTEPLGEPVEVADGKPLATTSEAEADEVVYQDATLGRVVVGKILRSIDDRYHGQVGAVVSPGYQTRATAADWVITTWKAKYDEQLSAAAPAPGTT